jgi:hypothetical protein
MNLQEDLDPEAWAGIMGRFDLGPAEAAAEVHESVAGGAAFTVVGGECLVPRAVLPTGTFEGKGVWSAFVAPRRYGAG